MEVISSVLCTCYIRNRSHGWSQVEPLLSLPSLKVKHQRHLVWFREKKSWLGFQNASFYLVKNML